MQFGESSSNAVPFLWQFDAGKLFLDQNRNGDLTDDPAGVFSAAHAEWNQTFTNVHLLFNTPAGKCPMLADISFYDSRSGPNCTLTLHSFWQGKVMLAGRDWQVGLIPNDLGHPIFAPGQTVAYENDQLLLRPWEKRNQTISVGVASDTVPLMQKLFVNGHAYQVTRITGLPNGEIKPTLQFAEQSAVLGELKITGKYIQRLILPGGPYLVVLDRPADTVKIPVGSYHQPNVLLEQGSNRAWCTDGSWVSGRRIVVDAKTPAGLDAGGPLTNSVIATRRGRNLELSYRLIGAGGATYQLDNQDRSRPPEFAIFKGDRKVASGKFAFG